MTYSPEIESNISKLIAADEAYWKHNNPVMPDEAYDILYEETRQAAPDHEYFKKLGHGTFDPKQGKVKHSKPMISLDKAHDEEKVNTWAEKIKKGITSTPKMDGLALALRYKDKKFHLAATRGNGEFGEDATDAASLVPNIPKNLRVKRDLEIRGEAYLPLSAYEKHLADDYESPRNVASGAISSKKKTGNRDDFEPLTKKVLGLMRFVAYDVVDSTRDSYASTLEALKSLGFTTPSPVCTTLKDGIDLRNKLDKNRDDLDMPVDGVVFRADSYEEFKLQGSTSHHPRAAIAFKFSAEVKETVVEGVEWSVGRTGAITPVGLVKPTYFPISSATISRVTFHNVGRIKELNLSIGAKIHLKRAGDCIPTVVDTIEEGHAPIEILKKCPLCNAKTELSNDILMCTGSECAGTIQKSIENYCKSVGMKGFGKVNVPLICEAGLVRNIADLYCMDKDVLSEVIGSKRNAERLLEQIENSRTLRTKDFMKALGVPLLGNSKSRDLAPLLPKEGLKPSSILSLPDIALEAGKLDEESTTFIQIRDGIEKIKDVIRKMDQHVKLLPEEKKEGHLSGKSFVFTGVFEQFKRKDGAKMAAEQGADTPSSVKKGLTHLVLGDGGVPKSKAKKEKAESLGVTLITESEFLVILKGEGNE